MKNYKIVIAHPGQQHSYHSAIALKDNLDKYITTQYYRKYHSYLWLMSLFIRNKNLKKRIIARHCDEINEKVVTYCTLKSLFSKVNYLPRIGYYKQFGKKVAKYAKKNKIDAVIMYDTTASECFKYLENTKIVKILDVTIGSRIYAKKIYETEMEKIKSDCFYKEYPDLWKPEYFQKFKNEIELADYAIVGSEYVKRTMIYSGMREDKIYIVPYGSTPRDYIIKDFDNYDKKLELLFVGQVNYRKGVHRLLEVIERFDETKIHLKIVGEVNDSNELFLKYKNDKRVTFTGLVPHSKIDEIYASSDVFVLPSLSEGMARVGIEAMNCGLPIICTENTGINDLIENSKNGFVIPISDSEALYEKINWFLINRDKIEEMSNCAKITAHKYTWNNYYKNYSNTIYEILEKENEKNINY